MTKGGVNLQDSFLNQVRREGKSVTLVLTSGASMEGVISGFDNFTVVLNTDKTRHLIYKHAIAQLVTARGADNGAALADAREGEAAPKASQPNRGKADTGSGAERKGAQESKPRSFNPLDLSGVMLQGAVAGDSPGGSPATSSDAANASSSKDG